MTRNGSASPFPNEFMSPPTWSSHTGSGRRGFRLRRYEGTLPGSYTSRKSSWSLGWRSAIDLGAEALDVVGRPAAVARHAARGESLVDRLRVRTDVVVRREVERERHRCYVAVAK